MSCLFFFCVPLNLRVCVYTSAHLTPKLCAGTPGLWTVSVYILSTHSTRWTQRALSNRPFSSRLPGGCCWRVDFAHRCCCPWFHITRSRHLDLTSFICTIYLSLMSCPVFQIPSFSVNPKDFLVDVVVITVSCDSEHLLLGIDTLSLQGMTKTIKSQVALKLLLLNDFFFFLVGQSPQPLN